jgi:predicted nucleic acid-binding Zn ribbon protein
MFIPARIIRKPEPDPIAEVIQKWLKENHLEDRFMQADIKTAWEELLGPVVARHTKSISLENKILKIRVDNAPLRQELFMSRSRIISLVNQRAGRQIALECLIF